MSLELQVASPCSENWDAMSPRGDRARFCAKCQLNVFDIASMTEVEVRALILAQQGRVCARLYRRADGTVLTRDCPEGVRRVRVRFLRGLAAAVTLLAGAVVWRVLARDAVCPADLAEPTALDHVSYAIQGRFIDAREILRDTQTLGPVIDKLWPRRPMVMGRLVSIPIIAPEKVNPLTPTLSPGGEGDSSEGSLEPGELP
ncbi:MAG: hypothetical protein U0228_19695 [Myxococcaceae bacterium]